MHFILAHHFWQDGKNATWMPKRFPVAEIEQLIKNEYEQLVQKQPAWQNIGNWTVFFVYHPNKDIFGRDLTEISLAIVEKLSDPKAIAHEVCDRLKGIAHEQLEMDLDCKQNHQGNQKKIMPIVLVICLLLTIIITIVWWLKNFSTQDKDLEKQLSNNSIVITEETNYKNSKNIEHKIKQEIILKPNSDNIIKNEPKQDPTLVHKNKIFEDDQQKQTFESENYYWKDLCPGGRLFSLFDLGKYVADQRLRKFVNVRCQEEISLKIFLSKEFNDNNLLIERNIKNYQTIESCLNAEGKRKLKNSNLEYNIKHAINEFFNLK